MSRLARILPLLLAALLAGGATSAAAQPAPVLSEAQSRYLALAQSGAARAESRWRDRRLGWYDERLHDDAAYPLATIWDIVPLFETLDGIATADPSAANIAALEGFARGAERYLNRGLRPLAGYSPYPGDREARTETWFDDNGWWGIGFANAYRASGRTRYLRDAERALRYIAAVGWDQQGGGIWWNTDHPYLAGEAIASGTLLATLIYAADGSKFALAQAQRFLAWANTRGFSAANGLYAASSISQTPIDYIQAPLIYAQQELCVLLSEQQLCARAHTLAAASLRRFGSELDFSPQYDAIYLQWMLATYSLDRDSALYELAAQNAAQAAANAANGEGLYLRSWSGEALAPSDAQPGLLQTQAATSSVFAWLAVYPPP